MRKKNKSSSIADGSSTEYDDRISSLPDEILHEILDCLRSHKQAAKSSLLSKRWNHLLLSYPVLEFDCTDYVYGQSLTSMMASFIASARRKLSSSGLNSYIKSLRIVSRDSDFIEAILDLIRNREPEEIDMTLCRDSVIPTLLLNSSRLRTLKLAGCKLLEDQYKMMNLRMIHLSNVNIDNRALSSMIAAAPLLEKLTLKDLYTSNRLELCNHANLKHLQISDMWNNSIEIVVGALDSLETLSLCWLTCHDLELCSSELPSLKSLEIEHCRDLKNHAVNKFISKSPSLLSLRLVHIDKGNELKIESPTLEKLELRWTDWDTRRVMLLHIDAPRLVDVCFDAYVECLPAISLQAADQSCRFVLSLKNCHPISSHKLKELKEFLRKVTQQLQFVQLHLYNICLLSKLLNDRDQVEGDSPTPVVERVEANQRLGLDQTFVYNMLWSCHPKYFSVQNQRLSSLKRINQAFMERTSPKCKKIACKCWRHQLKDVKIVNTNVKEGEELMDVSNDILSTLECGNRVLFRLIWH